MRAPVVALGLTVLAGCGAAWFDVPSHPHRAMAAVCAPVPADQRIVRFHDQVLVPVCEDLLADPATTEPQRAYLPRMWIAAVHNNEQFYGHLLALRPLTIWCMSDECDHYFLGDMEASATLPENGRAEGGEYVGDERRTIVLTHRDRIGRVLAHELSHTEYLYRIGEGEGAAWFNEGLATLVAGEDCTDIPRDPVALGQVYYQDDWNRYTEQEGHGAPTYCKAKDEVGAWFSRHGQNGLRALLRGLRQGGSFAALYGPLIAP